MAGEHILKLLIEENGRIDIGDRWLICEFGPSNKFEGIAYTVYERKSHTRSTKILTETEDEQSACRILKGE